MKKTISMLIIIIMVLMSLFTENISVGAEEKTGLISDGYTIEGQKYTIPKNSRYNKSNYYVNVEKIVKDKKHLKDWRKSYQSSDACLYTGKRIKPIVMTIKRYIPFSDISSQQNDKKDDVLKFNKDYKIIGYKNNQKCGFAYIKVKGIGKYTGISSKDISFTINPRVATKVKLAKSKGNITIKAKRGKGANRTRVNIFKGETICCTRFIKSKIINKKIKINKFTNKKDKLIVEITSEYKDKDKNIFENKSYHII